VSGKVPPIPDGNYSIKSPLKLHHAPPNALFIHSLHTKQNVSVEENTPSPLPSAHSPYLNQAIDLVLAYTLVKDLIAYAFIKAVNPYSHVETPRAEELNDIANALKGNKFGTTFDVKLKTANTIS